MLKVEDTILGHRQFMQAVVKDLELRFAYRGYKVTDTMETIQRKEGSVDIINYLARKYLNG